MEAKKEGIANERLERSEMVDLVIEEAWSFARAFGKKKETGVGR